MQLDNYNILSSYIIHTYANYAREYNNLSEYTYKIYNIHTHTYYSL